MKNILFIILLFNTCVSAQKSIFTIADSIYIENNIINILKSIKEGADTKVLYNPDILSLDKISKIKYQKNSELYHKQIEEKTKLFLFMLNELGNYIKNIDTDSHSLSEAIIPPCFRDTALIQYPHQPLIEEILDNECKLLFIKLLKEREDEKKRRDYLNPIYSKYYRIVQDLVITLNSDSVASKDINKYIRPLEVNCFGDLKNQQYFRRVLKGFIKVNKE